MPVSLAHSVGYSMLQEEALRVVGSELHSGTKRQFGSTFFYCRGLCGLEGIRGLPDIKTGR